MRVTRKELAWSPQKKIRCRQIVSYIALQCEPEPSFLPGKNCCNMGARRAEAYNKTTKKCSAQLAQIYDLQQTKAYSEAALESCQILLTNMVDLIHFVGSKVWSFIQLGC